MKHGYKSYVLNLTWIQLLKKVRSGFYDFFLTVEHWNTEKGSHSVGALTRNILFPLRNSYGLLPFLPTDYETWLYKLFMELGLNPIIEIFHSGFYEFPLAVELWNTEKSSHLAAWLKSLGLEL